MTKSARHFNHQAPMTHQRSRLNLKFLNIFLFASLAVLGVMYLINISDLTVQGFALRDLKSQVSDLASEKMANEEVVNAAQSYYSLNTRAAGLDMVAISDIVYLPGNNLTVAKK